MNDLKKLPIESLLINRIISFFRVFIFLIILTAFLVINNFKHYFPYDMNWKIIVCIVLFVVSDLWIELMILDTLNYNNYWYKLSKNYMYICEGVLFSKKTTIPIRTINYVSIKKHPISNYKKLVKIELGTLSSVHTIQFLSLHQANKIKKMILEAKEVT